jgi:hypothetical protein
MEDKLLMLILDYEMNKIEAKAWKIAILYLQLTKKYLPDYKHSFISLGKDPRKTALFKICYKLVRESKLQDHEFRLYITAQMQVLKTINCGDCHAYFTPNCLTGNKAWNRWLVWKKKFNQIKEVDRNATNSEIFKTKKFLVSKLTLSKEKIIEILNNRTLFKWIALGHVSPYYLALSPIVKEWLEKTKTNLLDTFDIDLSLYKTNEELVNYFTKEFSYEFET